MDVTAARWNTLSKLLDEALDLDAPVRTAWLDELAATRPDVAPAVRKLLAAHATAETADVLARLPTLNLRAAAARGDGLAAGERIGPYRLLRELGSGGMADVWLAERADGALERQVALKLPLVSRVRRDIAERFARERDILARLEHPHIARLYDAGLDASGLPFLALEYVDGQPITRDCDARQLDIPARLRLFLQVLDAVQYAHASLVIHRDLKPSNILVTAGGQVRLLDFGIAKLLAADAAVDETRLTRIAGRALTPEYASPEQIRGEALTIATDVYSLGVVLYELLSGTRPYRLKTQSAAQLEEAIVGADAPRPSTAGTAAAALARGTSAARLARALAGDLDTIVLKALAKAPAQRYATVAAFAEDLQRHLDGRPVRARPASVGYRARRFITRNRLAVGAGGGIGAALLLGAALTLWQAQEARHQAARAEAVKEFLTGLFEANSLEPEDSARRRQLTAGQLLEEGALRIGSHFADEPGLRAELQGVLGRLLHDLSLSEQALALRQDRLRTLEATDAGLLARAQALRELADTLAQKGQKTAARAELGKAIDLLEPDRAREAAVLRWSLVSTLGYLNMESGDRALGAEQVASAVDRLRVIAPNSLDFAEALLRQGEALSIANRTEASIPMVREGLQRLQEQLGPRSIRLARHRFRIAGAFFSQRRFAEAEEQYRLALRTMIDTAGMTHPGTAVVQLNLGRLLSIQGRPGEARTLLEPAAATLLARQGDVDPLHAADAQLFLAEALLDEGRVGAAGAPLRLAMQRYEGIDNMVSRTVAQAIHARYLLDTGRYDDALQRLEQSRAQRALALGADHPAVAALTNRIGLVHMAAGRTELAERTFRSVRESQANREEVFGSPQHLAGLNLAMLDIEGGRFAAALPAIERFASSFEAQPDSQRSRASEFSVRNRLARALLGVGRVTEARAQVEQAQQIAGELFEHGPARIQARTLTARLLAAEGDLAGARAELKLARTSLQAHPELGPHFERSVARAEQDIERGR
jgi:tetratricopeptide (TPR) repeat protein